MDELIANAGIVVAGVLGAAFCFQQLYLNASYQMHKLQKMDASATETQQTETIPGPGK